MARDAGSLRRVGRVVLAVNSGVLIGMLVGLFAEGSTGNAAVWKPVLAALLGIFLLGTIALAIIAILVRRAS